LKNDGFIFLDKPCGITSRQADWRVAKLFGQKKFGHIGTLDPMASGLLIVALGEATKMIPFLESSKVSEFQCSKEYLFSITWGIQTDTDDITGKVIKEEREKRKEEFDIHKILAEFPREYDQMPPDFSAKKVAGIPAYKIARNGKKPVLLPKKVKIYELESAGQGEYRVRCSAGTYIRSLVRDIAAMAGTIATTSMIRRMRTNGVDIKNAVGLEFLENICNNGGAITDYLQPLDFGLDDIPAAKLETDDADLFRNGGFVRFAKCKTQSANGEIARVYSNNEFIGIGEVENGVIKPKRILKCRK